MASAEPPRLPPEDGPIDAHKREKQAARAELERLRARHPNGADGDAAEKVRRLERRIREIDGEIERRELAAEIERQSDA